LIVGNLTWSQPARMRCGKDGYARDKTGKNYGRNPHECAVAKHLRASACRGRQVATRTNALWQSEGK